MSEYNDDFERLAPGAFYLLQIVGVDPRKAVTVGVDEKSVPQSADVRHLAERLSVTVEEPKSVPTQGSWFGASHEEYTVTLRLAGDVTWRNGTVGPLDVEWSVVTRFSEMQAHAEKLCGLVGIRLRDGPCGIRLSDAGLQWEIAPEDQIYNKSEKKYVGKKIQKWEECRNNPHTHTRARRRREFFEAVIHQWFLRGDSGGHDPQLSEHQLRPDMFPAWFAYLEGVLDLSRGANLVREQEHRATCLHLETTRERLEAEHATNLRAARCICPSQTLPPPVPRPLCCGAHGRCGAMAGPGSMRTWRRRSSCARSP